MSPATSKRLAAVAALLVGAGAIAFLAFGSLEENIVYYWTPTDLLAKGEQIKGSTLRLGGMVQTGSVDWDAEAMRLRFTLGEQPEPEGASVVVVSSGAPPQMFREGIGCIVEGRWDGSVFRSDRVMVKHSNEYQPPDEGEDPRKLYETLIPNRMPDKMRERLDSAHGDEPTAGAEPAPEPTAGAEPAPAPTAGAEPAPEPAPTAGAQPAPEPTAGSEPVPNPAPTPTPPGESP